MSLPRPSWDPLGRSIRLEYSAKLFPLGFLATLETNDPAVIEVARASWPGPDRRRLLEPLRLRVFVSPGPASSTPPAYRADDDRLALFADPAHGASVDLQAGRMAIWTSAGTVATPERFRRWYLDGIMLEALSFQALTPIHSAAIVREGRATLLCGPSGSGKSTLAAACVEAGWSLLGDDAAYLLRQTDRVLGRGGPLRLDARSLKLLGRADAPAENALSEPVAEIEASLRTDEARLERIVFLDRSIRGREAGWSSIPAREALERLVAEVPLSAEATAAAQSASLAAVAPLARRLSYSRLADAVAMLGGDAGAQR